MRTSKTRSQEKTNSYDSVSREPDDSGLTAIDPVNKAATDTVNRRSNRLIKKSVWYDDGAVWKFSKMMKESAVQVNDRPLPVTDAVSMMSYTQSFEAVCDIWCIHEAAAIWLFEYYLSRSV